jgi:hypothetical protein
MMRSLKSILSALAMLLVAAPAAPRLLAVTVADSLVADAAMRGDAERVRTLLRDGADVNAAQGDGMTALHWTALNGDLDTTNVLLVAGATVDPLTRVGRYTPLHLASSRGHASVVSRLLDAGSKPNATTETGFSRCISPAGGRRRNRHGAPRPRGQRQRARRDARPDPARLRRVAEPPRGGQDSCSPRERIPG